MPDPLHPAIVHFPVVLIVLGALTATVAVFWRRHPLPVIAGVLLGLGAIGAWAAVATGKADGSLVEGLSPVAEALLESHQDWAERTLVLAAIAAVAALASTTLGRWPGLARTMAVIAAVVSLAAGYAVFETGHRGGALVFRHGAGVAANATTETQPAK